MKSILFILLYIFASFMIDVESITCRKKRCRGKTRSAKDVTCLKSACQNSILTARNNITCEGDVSCLGATLESTKADILCPGERSCKEADITANGNVYCNGFKSCSEAVSITAGNNIVADSWLTAYFVDPMMASGDIYCLGGMSSSFATIACHASNLIATNIYCLGYGPSNYNTMTVEDSVTCDGYEACHNAQISSSTNTLTVSCSQTYSCMDTEITCPDNYCKISCIPGGTSGVSGCLSGTFDDTEVYYTANTNLIVEPPLCDTRNGGAGDKNCPNLNLITAEERDEMLKNRAKRILPDDAYIYEDEDDDDEFMSFVGQVTTDHGMNGTYQMILFMVIGVVIGVVFMVIIERFLSNKGAKYQILE